MVYNILLKFSNDPNSEVTYPVNFLTCKRSKKKKKKKRKEGKSMAQASGNAEMS